MRTLVTGARGFIGAATVQAALKRKHDVAVLVRPGATHGRLHDVAGALTWIEADLGALATPTVERAVAAFAPDVVIHAGWDGVLGRERNEPWQVSRNVPAAVSLVTLAAHCGARHFIGLGSQAEYGACSGRITESQPLRPTTMYGAAKVAAGAVTQCATSLHGMQYSWLRVFSTYGVDSDPSWVLPMVASSIAKGTAPQLTACEQRWEFLHVADAAAALLAVATTGATGTYNLGCGTAHVLRNVVLSLRDRIDPAVLPAFGAVPYRPDQVMHLEADITRLQQATGWQPATPLATGLDEIAARAIADAATFHLASAHG